MKINNTEEWIHRKEVEIINQLYTEDKICFRKNLFNYIRDIPFYVAQGVSLDRKRSLAYIIKNGRGSCSPKHILLSDLFNKIGIDSKFVTYKFYWHQQHLPLSEKLKNLSKMIPPQYHLATLVNVGGKYVLIDATWDYKLKKGKFPVNEWDGISNTKNAIYPVEETVHESLKERNSYILREISIYKDDQKTIKYIRKFYYLLNDWLMYIRYL